MSKNNRGDKSGRRLKYATSCSEEVKKGYDAGKLHECGLSIYFIICEKEVKMCDTFYITNWYSHTQTACHTSNKQTR